MNRELTIHELFNIDSGEPESHFFFNGEKTNVCFTDEFDASLPGVTCEDVVNKLTIRLAEATDMTPEELERTHTSLMNMMRRGYK